MAKGRKRKGKKLPTLNDVKVPKDGLGLRSPSLRRDMGKIPGLA